MNESEQAELFNKELDAVLRGVGDVFSASDPGAIELAAALARADFSGDSSIKEALRLRLAAGRTAPYAGFAERALGLLRSSGARAALAAACLVLVLLPLARRLPGPARPPAAQPLSSPVQAVRPAVPAEAAAARVEAPQGGVFSSIPMARLEGDPIKDFPIERAGGGAPIILTRGRGIKTGSGSGIRWETERSVFILERRVISRDGLFRRRSI